MVTVRIRITGGIEPVARLVLTVTRRVEQAVHQFLVSIGVPISEERVHFLRCGWQAGQVEGGTTNERGFVSFA